MAHTAQTLSFSELLKVTKALRSNLHSTHDLLHELVKDETCDHSVGICWCGIQYQLQLNKRLLEKVKQS